MMSLLCEALLCEAAQGRSVLHIGAFMLASWLFSPVALVERSVRCWLHVGCACLQLLSAQA